VCKARPGWFGRMDERPFWGDAPVLAQCWSCACGREDNPIKSSLGDLDFGRGEFAAPARPMTPPPRVASDAADDALAWGKRDLLSDQMQIEATILSGHSQSKQGAAECEFMMVRDQSVPSTPGHHLPEEFACEYWMQAAGTASVGADVPDRHAKPSPPTSQYDRKRILTAHPSAFLDPDPKSAQELYLARRRSFLSDRE
jgi:hypothetical protein